MTTTPVVPVPIGSYVPGLITISTFGQGHTSDTDLWVYDSNLNAIAGYGNDDESTLAASPGNGSTLQSWLPRNYAPGRYYIAMSTFQHAGVSPSPSDDDFRTGSLLDFPDIAAASSTTTNVNMTFTIADSGGSSLQVPNTKVNAFDINWFVFDVVPEPSSLALLGLAVPMFLRRRK
jgi:hypothetical protein